MSKANTIDNHPPRFDSAVPERERCLVPALPEHYTATTPDKVLVVFEDGSEWTCLEALERTRDAAGGLRELSVAVGDTVLAWLPNGPELQLSRFAVSCLGAVVVPINPSYKGKLLRHVLCQTDAMPMVGHARLLPGLQQIEPTQLEAAVCSDGTFDTGTLPGGVTRHEACVLNETSDPVSTAHPVERWDAMMIIYTSATTGPAKRFLTTYLQQYTIGRVSFGYLTEDDRMFVILPMFRVSGTTVAVWAGVRALPKAPTNKVLKTERRDAGVTADTWDREADGIALRKQPVSQQQRA